MTRNVRQIVREELRRADRAQATEPDERRVALTADQLNERIARAKRSAVREERSRLLQLLDEHGVDALVAEMKNARGG